MSLDADSKYIEVSSQASSDSWLIKFTPCPGSEFVTDDANNAYNSCYYAYIHEHCLHPVIITAVTMLTKNIWKCSHNKHVVSECGWDVYPSSSCER